VWHYALPMALFAYCYGSILHVIRRQKNIIGVHLEHRQGFATTPTTTSRDQVVTSTAATPVTNLSRKEMNVLNLLGRYCFCETAYILFS